MKNQLLKMGWIAILMIQKSDAITFKRIVLSHNDMWNEVISAERSTAAIKELNEDDCNKLLERIHTVKIHFVQSAREDEEFKSRLEGIHYQLTFLTVHYEDLHKWGSTLYKIFNDLSNSDYHLKCAELERKHPEAGILIDGVRNCVAQYQEGYERFNASFYAPKMVGVLSWFANT